MKLLDVHWPRTTRTDGTRTRCIVREVGESALTQDDVFATFMNRAIAQKEPTSMVNVQLQKPSGGTFEQRLQPGLAIGKCVDITEGEDKGFGPTMFWWWEVAYTGKTARDIIPASLNEDGSVYRLRDMTSTKFGKGKTTDKTAKARVRVEALLKREIDDDEPLDGLLDQCLGKPALLYLVANEAGYLNVQLVQPYKSGTLAPMPAQPEPESEELPFDSGAPDDPDQAPF